MGSGHVKKKKRNPFIDEMAGVGDRDSSEEETSSEDEHEVEVDGNEHDADDLIIPQHLTDRQDDTERRAAASAGLLSLMYASPPAAGPTNNVLDTEAAATDARKIAARLDERARKHTTFMYEEHDTGDILTQVALGPTVHDDPMWRVRVRHGHEVDIVFKLLQQRIDKEQARINDETFRVASATFQPCIPGSIYVEAPSAQHVRLACGGLHGMMGSIELVSLDDAVAVLTCGAGPQVLDPHSWVRIRRGLYTGDLAFVRSVVDHVPDEEDDEDVFPSTIVTINLVPRIPLGIKMHKRKRQTISDRALPVLFDSRRYETECQRIKRDEDGRAQEDMWKFRRAIYRNGLLEMRVVMSSLNFKKVNPTREELEKWVESSDEDVVLAAKNALVASRSENHASGLRVGDRVEIKQGWAHTKKGKVQSIEGDVVLMDDLTSSSSPPISVRISDVRKYFVVGDNVWALSGPEVGLEGWCIKIEDGIVQVSEHGTRREFWVEPEHLQLRLPVIAFGKPPPPPLTYLPGYKPIEFNAPRLPMRQTMWNGMHVRITGTMGKICEDGYTCPVPCKGYEAYIKSVNEYWPKDPEAPNDPVERIEYYRNLPRPKEASLSHQQGYICASGCPACLPTSLSVDVEIPAQGLRLLQKLDICFIQPADDILPPTIWKWALKLNHWKDDFPIITRQDFRKVKWPSNAVQKCWQSGVMELLQCQQWQERLLFEARCRMIDDDVQGRDALIANMNKLDLRPFWRPVILNTPDTCTGSPPDPPAEDPPAKDPPKGYTRTGTPLPDEDENNLEDAWNPRARNVDADGWEVDADGWTIGRKIEKKTYSVEETWLDDELRKLPLFLVMASGSRALNPDTENVQATLKSSSSGDLVDLRLLRTNHPRDLKSIHIRHLLPVHPSMAEGPVTSSAKQYVVFIRVSLKGEVRLLDKMEGDQVWVKNPDDGELSDHSKYDLVLSREVKLKGKGIKKGKGKGKQS